MGVCVGVWFEREEHMGESARSEARRLVRDERASDDRIGASFMREPMRRCLVCGTLHRLELFEHWEYICEHCEESMCRARAIRIDAAVAARVRPIR